MKARFQDLYRVIDIRKKAAAARLDRASKALNAAEEDLKQQRDTLTNLVQSGEQHIHNFLVDTISEDNNRQTLPQNNLMKLYKLRALTAELDHNTSQQEQLIAQKIALVEQSENHKDEVQKLYAKAYRRFQKIEKMTEIMHKKWTIEQEISRENGALEGDTRFKMPKII